jgi:AraC family transcriptional regulator of arabinose operon
MKTQKIPFTRDRARDATTFIPYADFPAIIPSQLDAWLSAVKIKAVSAIEWEWSRHWTVGPRVLNDSMYFWFKSGSGKAWFGSPTNIYHFEAGDLLLIPQGVEHAIEGTAGEEPHVYAVHFYATLYGGIDLLNLLGFPLHVPYRKSAPYRGLSEHMVRDYAVKAPGWSTMIANDVFSLLLYLIRTEMDTFSPPASVDWQSQLPRLLPVLDWIDRHLSSHEMTVADLSKHVFISETHFRRLFQKVFGMSPVQFIRQRRVDRACALLRATDSPIKQIAQECGFADDAFFSRVFHQLVGASPAAYRREELR